MAYRQLPPVAAVVSFIDCINRGDVDGLGMLMTDDHGAERVARYLRVEIADGEPSAQGITAGVSATPPPRGDTMAAAPVFSRFLRHLAYLELATTTAPLPEMQWFPPTRVVP